MTPADTFLHHDADDAWYSDYSRKCDAQKRIPTAEELRMAYAVARAIREKEVRAVVKPEPAVKLAPVSPWLAVSIAVVGLPLMGWLFIEEWWRTWRQ